MCSPPPQVPEKAMAPAVVSDVILEAPTEVPAVREATKAVSVSFKAKEGAKPARDPVAGELGLPLCLSY